MKKTRIKFNIPAPSPEEVEEFEKQLRLMGEFETVPEIDEFNAKEAARDAAIRSGVYPSYNKGELDGVAPKAYDDGDYKREAKEIRDRILKAKLPGSDYTLAHLRILAAKDGVDVECLVWNIVLSYNQRGRKYTAHRFRFALDHRFDWLPDTDWVANTGLMLSGPQRKIVKWAPGLPPDWQIRRRLKTAPDAKWLSRRLTIVSTKRARKAKSRSYLSRDAAIAGIEEYRASYGTYSPVIHKEL